MTIEKANEPDEEDDDDEDEEPKTSWWEDRMLHEAKEQTRLLAQVNRNILAIGIVILLAGVMFILNALGLLGTIGYLARF